MSVPFLGQLMYFGGNFAPLTWAFCNGQQLQVSQNSALFSLLGTIYGGNGIQTFALPDMRGRVPIHQGQGVGLSDYTIGESGGAENVTLNAGQLPQHNHTMTVSQNKATTAAATATPLSMLGRAVATTQIPYIYIPAAQSAGRTALGAAAINSAGSGSPTAFSVVQPILAINCTIALNGIFPSRN